MDLCRHQAQPSLLTQFSFACLGLIIAKEAPKTTFGHVADHLQLNFTFFGDCSKSLALIEANELAKQDCGFFY